jgi:hypothetical protein
MPTIGFPLLLIPLALYNIIVFLMPGVAFTAPVATLALPSGVSWTFTFGDVLLALSLIRLLFEVVKAARPGSKYVTDHLLSLVVFGGAVAEFLLLKPFGTSTFFLLTLLAGVDFLGSASIALRRDRRRAAAPAPAVVVPAPAPVEQPSRSTPRVEPVIEPSPKPVPELVSPPPIVTVAPQDNAPVTAEPKAPDTIANWNVSEIVSGIETPPDKAPESHAPKAPDSKIEPKPSDKL